MTILFLILAITASALLLLAFSLCKISKKKTPKNDAGLYGFLPEKDVKLISEALSNDNTKY
jgi:hypothetical protein